MQRTFRISAIIACIGLFAGCQISPRRGTISGGGGGGTGGQLYISTPSSILHFNNAETATGNVAPVSTITGSNTQLSSPQHLFLDTANDRLYVANQGGSSVLVFDAVSTLTGTVNQTPTRVLSGAATNLTAPTDVTLDPTNNLLYVANGTSILVFAGASTVSGNTPPVRNINMGVSIGGLFLDATNNQLYVSDPGDNAVDRLDGASAQDVVGVVGGAIAGPDTKLSQPRGLALDASGRLLVSNSSTPASITVYPNAGVTTGDLIPSVVIAASGTTNNTLLQSPGQIALNRNVGNGELFVLDPLAASVLIFTNAPTNGGNIAPARNINGSNTGITASAVNGLAIDPTR
jgi:hypothetical protein